jgi:hypothetical protein
LPTITHKSYLGIPILKPNLEFRVLDANILLEIKNCFDAISIDYRSTQLMMIEKEKWIENYTNRKVLY